MSGTHIRPMQSLRDVRDAHRPGTHIGYAMSATQVGDAIRMRYVMRSTVRDSFGTYVGYEMSGTHGDCAMLPGLTWAMVLVARWCSCSTPAKCSVTQVLSLSLAYAMLGTDLGCRTIGLRDVWDY
eukprot:2847097-Rhodomonas_salina.5